LIVTVSPAQLPRSSSGKSNCRDRANSRANSRSASALWAAAAKASNANEAAAVRAWDATISAKDFESSNVL
jgi:hypothetical protein